MTSTAPTSIAALPRGHEFAPETFTLSHTQVASYLAATGDATAYGQAVPPLAVAALGLNALQSIISLPEGSLHTGQEVEHLASVTAEQPLTLTGRIAQRSERQGFVISVIEFEISADGQPAIRARTTIMAPGSAA